MWQFENEDIVSLQNRASDVWNASVAPEDHEEYVAVVNRLLGAMEMFWHIGTKKIPFKERI